MSLWMTALERWLMPVVSLVLGYVLFREGHTEVGFLLIGTAVGIPLPQRLGKKPAA